MRLVVKLSGESLGGSKGAHQYDQNVLSDIASQIESLRTQGHQIGLVVGGGNLFRGQQLKEVLSIERSSADYIGMLATVQNALVIRDFFETKGIVTRVSTAISMPQICEMYMPQRALRHLEKGRVVIFAAGLGVPYFTTDSTSVQRALEMKADLLIMAKNGVDGLYDGDPNKNPSAKFLKSVTSSIVLEQNLKAADQSAIALAREHKLNIKVVGIENIKNALREDVGSLIVPE